MTIRYTIGNIFESKVSGLVNPVNAEGYMGRGIAKAFKEVFPVNFKVYKKNPPSIGSVLSVPIEGTSTTIFNLPTKDEWREPSLMRYIESGVDALIDEVKRLDIKSVAIPPLGVGLGGLSWVKVKELLEYKLGNVNDVDWVLYTPLEQQHTINRLLVCGGRNMMEIYPLYRYFRDFKTTIGESISNPVDLNDFTIVQGGAHGADAIASHLAKLFRFNEEEYKANWDLHGKKAGYLRNSEMVNVTDGTLAYWDRISKGTQSSISLTNKASKPNMIEFGEIPTGMNDKELTLYLTKRHLINLLTFNDPIEGKEYLEEIFKYEGDDIQSLVRQLQSSDLVKPKTLGNTNLNYFHDMLFASGYTLLILNDVTVELLELKDIIVPKRKNLIYLKLDTGGFSGYDNRIRGLGEKHYPILRITVAVNDNPAIDILINPMDDINKINDGTRRLHEASGLLDLVTSDGVKGLGEAKVLLHEYLNGHGVVATSPIDNVHTVLVGYNTEFLMAFIKAQIPSLGNLLSPNALDLYKLATVHELMGNYKAIPRPQLYRNDPIEYIDCLRNGFKQLLGGI